MRKVTLTDGSGTIDTEYYRYYTQADETSGKPGYKGAMMYAFGPASYSRMVADLGDNLEPRTDAEVGAYADSYFEYFMTHADPGRVKQHKAQGAGGTAANGLGEFNYTYTRSGHNPADEGYNAWIYKTVETFASDGTQTIVYANKAGGTMLKIIVSDVQTWIWYYEYDNAGREILRQSVGGQRLQHQLDREKPHRPNRSGRSRSSQGQCRFNPHNHI